MSLSKDFELAYLEDAAYQLLQNPLAPDLYWTWLFYWAYQIQPSVLWADFRLVFLFIQEYDRLQPAAPKPFSGCSCFTDHKRLPKIEQGAGETFDRLVHVLKDDGTPESFQVPVTPQFWLMDIFGEKLEEFESEAIGDLDDGTIRVRLHASQTERVGRFLWECAIGSGGEQRILKLKSNEFLLRS